MRVGWIGVVCLAACTAEPVTPVTKTFVISQLLIPGDDDQIEQFGTDYNGDGRVNFEDNALSGVANSLQLFNIDLNFLFESSFSRAVFLIGLEVAAKNFQKEEEAEGVIFLADLESIKSPRFDGTDLIQVDEEIGLFSFQGEITESRLRTQFSSFVFPLPRTKEAPFLLPMQNLIIRGLLDETAGTITDGTLSGTIDALSFAQRFPDFAVLMDERIEAAAFDFALQNGPSSDLIPCQQEADCAFGENIGFCTDSNGDGLATGVCMSADHPLVPSFGLFDEDNDGLIEVQFDEQSQSFLQNDLSFLFNLVGGNPTGILGGGFQLDLNGDGQKDALGIGLGFTAVTALR